MQWEDHFKEEEESGLESNADRLSRLSDWLVGSLSDHISRKVIEGPFTGLDDAVRSSIVASALLRILMGTSLHGFHRLGAHSEIHSEEELARNPEAFSNVVTHIVTTLGGVLDTIDTKHAHSIQVVRKEKP